MITNGFTYIAVLVFIAALLVWLQRYTKSKFFDYAPPIVLLYLITMILCTLGAWDMEATKPAYSVLKNNLLLYSVVALLASRASFLELTDAPAWILAGFMILAIHGIILVLLAKIFHLDMFTCGVASLANIGGSASAPILAGAYSGALVPVGVLMALMGYVIGTAGGLITANIMALLA